MEKPWLKFYDEGVPHTLDYPEVPLHWFLEESARKYPDSIATILPGRFGDTKLTYRELNELANRLANALIDLGVKKGDRVALYMPNCPQFVIGYSAILKAGGIVVATSPLYSPREVEHQFNDSGAETVIVLSLFYPMVKQVQPKTRVKKVIVSNIKEHLGGIDNLLFGLLKEKKEGHRVELAEGDLWLKDLLEKYPADDPNVDVGADDTALFQYTGGTTGVPKAAVILHRNLVANALQASAFLPDLKMAEEIHLAAIPLFHVFGMVAVMAWSMSIGAAMILVTNPRDIDALLKAINKYKPTLFMGVPTMYNAVNHHPDIAKYDVKSVRACISGSAPLPMAVKETFEELTGGKLVEGYGLTEAPTATHCNPMYGMNLEGSIGLPLPDVEAKIVDIDTGTKDLPVGETGELVLRSPNVMKEYWNMPEETEIALREGWLYTGDIALMDENGYFFIVDRKKDMIIASGLNVYPSEVEDVLYEHPKIQETAVAGIPDPKRGETVKAWVVLKPGETATVDEIRDFCRDKLAKYKIPYYVEFRDELPKTMVGKVLRRALAEEEAKKQEQ
ncbi:MAG: long-chain fatty acid--CoA ligase [Chloroflexi bacterium B3_Chlor]|nr:MAG: long-chain fatty acid--CoA ligase [Chloroflexi bacterium B3_Chlor]